MSNVKDDDDVAASDQAANESVSEDSAERVSLKRDSSEEGTIYLVRFKSREISVLLGASVFPTNL